jgi:uncharacterized membrane protein
MAAITIGHDIETDPVPAHHHSHHHHGFQMPALRGLLRRAGPSIVEGSLVPAVVLALGLHFAGLRFGLLAALAWTLGAVGVRVARGYRVSGLLMLSSCTLTAKTAFAVMTDDSVVYFMQPVVVTLLVAVVFLATAFTSRPLAWRLANDFCPVPAHLLGEHHVGRFFRRLSIAWAFVNITKAGVTVWMFEQVPVAQFVMLKPLLSLTLVGGAVVVSVLSFRSAMTRPSPVAI